MRGGRGRCSIGNSWLLITRPAPHTNKVQTNCPAPCFARRSLELISRSQSRAHLELELELLPPRLQVPGQAGGCGAATIGAMCGPFLKPSEWVYIESSVLWRKVFVYLSVSRWVAFCRSWPFSCVWAGGRNLVIVISGYWEDERGDATWRPGTRSYFRQTQTGHSYTVGLYFHATLIVSVMLKYDVVAGTLQDIVYLICTGTGQCLWPSGPPRLRGGGV